MDLLSVSAFKERRMSPVASACGSDAQCFICKCSRHIRIITSPPPRKVVCVSVGGVHELCAWKYQEIAGKLCLPVNASCHFSNCLRHQDLRHQRQYAELNVFDAGLCQHSPKRAPRERQSFVIAFCALHWARSQRQLATMSLARYGIVRSLT
jgi:hypothetical protein